MTTVSSTARSRVLITEISDAPEAAALAKTISGEDVMFFLDSADVNHRCGRYSFVGTRPLVTLSAYGREIESVEGGRRSHYSASPFDALRSALRRLRIPRAQRDLPFCGGAVGYLGYDLRHFIERLPQSSAPDISLPDMFFAFYDSVVAFDSWTGRCFLCIVEFDETDVAPRGRRQENECYWRETLAKARGVGDVAGAYVSVGGDIVSNFTRSEYLDAVAKAKEYIAAGDIFQVNLSQRFSGVLDSSAMDLYGMLRCVNPAPFAALLKLGDKAVVSSSPERFLKVTDDRVETRPIKGTRPRRGVADVDDVVREALYRSEKDNAELAMIIDLERNDLGRVCRYGSVRVTEKKVVEEFPTVYHLVGTIEGRLHQRYDVVDLLKATFPGGSITGAPKIRAMEIIDELEPHCRNLYTGSVGYIGFDGDADLNIVIRTFLVDEGRLYFQVGGGIIADSDPAAEYDETIDKARALFRSLGISV